MSKTCFICGSSLTHDGDWDQNGTLISDFRCNYGHLTQVVADQPYIQTFVLEYDGMELYTLDHIEGQLVQIRDWDQPTVIRINLEGSTL